LGRAIGIIQSEHRGLAAILHTLEQLLRAQREHGGDPDFSVYRAILDYLEQFPDRFHHPKEDAYLFRALARRCPEMREVLDRLRGEHDHGYHMTAQLREALEAWESDRARGFDAFDRLASRYVDEERKHIRLEEQEVLPAAARALTDEDWAVIDAAFVENGDPLFGAEPSAEFRKLFSRVVALVPSPLGLGPSRPAAGD